MIDLHIHTTFSDGTKTVVDTLKEANNARLSLISVTDHNVIDAYTMLNQKVTREEFDGKIITGVELTTSLDNEIVEILGYGFDVDRMKENMTGNILTFKEYKIKEYELTIETYRNRGIKIDENNIKFSPDRESCREHILKECARYPENIERLLDKGSLKSVGRFSRNEFYNPESDFFVNLSVHYPSFQETIDMIHNAGGYAFFAHPFVYSSNITTKMQSVIDKYNLDGIECYYYSFTKEQTEHLLELCSKNNLLISGGSDYRGNDTIRKGVELGKGRGDLKVNEKQCEIWTSKLKDYR